MQHRRCTLQVTIGILLVFAAACGEDKAVPTSGPAGLVISVQGDVSATRPGQATRALEVNDTVFGEDTLVTGRASSVEVELVHNGARWQLGADSERRVDTSVAWRAKQQKQALLSPHEEIKTGSAGRNTTREAAEPRETLLEPGAEVEEAAKAAPVQSEPDRQAMRETVRKPSSRSKSKGSRQKTSDSRQLVQPLRLETIQIEPPPPAPARARDDAENAGKADDRESTPAAASIPEPTPKAAKQPAAAAAPLRSHVLAVTSRCHAEHGGRGTLRVAITVKGGKASQLQVNSPEALAAVRRCVDSALRGVALPAGGPLVESIPL